MSDIFTVSFIIYKHSTYMTETKENHSNKIDAHSNNKAGAQVLAEVTKFNSHTYIKARGVNPRYRYNLLQYVEDMSNSSGAIRAQVKFSNFLIKLHSQRASS